ncbi:hypothetical protein [Demequina sp. NBRC 110051]|uniref:hypothetical protein n=1 Tax=Demequina sp. NBRC 110051 TaxID=1570340 RepID=UPI000A04B56E|nr:hypothetical protein [Demequina sp. NBRC 110051]
MITTATPRRRAGQRIASALWGLLVIGAGVTMAVAFSGYEIDLELAAIIALTAVGGWLILSAALSSIGRSREVRAATAPVAEDTYSAPSEPTPTEVIFAEASTPKAPATDSANQDEPRHAEPTDASATEDGVSDADPVQSVGEDRKDPDAKRD